MFHMVDPRRTNDDCIILRIVLTVCLDQTCDVSKVKGPIHSCCHDLKISTLIKVF